MSTSEHEPYPVNSLCRICLNYLGRNPRPGCHSAVYDLFLDFELARKLSLCTGVQVEQQDGMPRLLCYGCHGRLNDVNEFQRLCLDSQKKFNEMVASNRIIRIGCYGEEEEEEEEEHQQQLYRHEKDIQVQDNGDEEETIASSFDPLMSHKMEMIENEEEVFKLLETVDKEVVIADQEDGEDEDDDVEEATPSETEEKQEKDDDDNNKQQEDLSSDDDLPLAHRLSNLSKRQRISIAQRRHQRRIITCQICQQKFKKQSKFDEHMKHHNDLLPFQCSEESCKKGFTTMGALRLHVDYAHTKKTPEIPCSVENCKLLFPRLRLLTIHLKKVHNLTRSTPPRVDQPCTECGQIFRCQVALKKHMYKHTGEELPYPCNICGKGFHINSALKNHLLRHAGIKNYVCPYCGVGKTTRQEWSKHMLTHTQEKQFKCEICQHATHTKRALDNHVKIVHEKIRNFACQYCGKTFGKSHACKIHEMTHTGEKRCECKVCGKKFLYTESLTKHLKIHEKSVDRALETYRQRQEESGNDPSQMDAKDLLKVCAESVATIPKDPRRVERVDMAQLAGTVINPISIVSLPAPVMDSKISTAVAADSAGAAAAAAHPSSPPPPPPPPSSSSSSRPSPPLRFIQKEGMHLCPDCNQGFNNLGNMKRHYKSVHEKVKDFECRFCSRRFANSQSLKQHEWIHTGEKPYACKICGNHFRQEAALIRHQKVHEEKPSKPTKLPKEITEKVREKEILKCERKRKVEALRQEIAEVAKEELKDLAKQKVKEKELNSYEQYQQAAAAAATSASASATAVKGKKATKIDDNPDKSNGPNADPS